MAAIKCIETRLITFLVQLRDDSGAAAIEWQHFILAAMRNVDGRFTLTSI